MKFKGFARWDKGHMHMGCWEGCVELFECKGKLKETQTEVIKGSSKREREELEQESAKKQKLVEQVQDEVDDTTELKKCLEIVPEDDDDVAIEATPLSSGSPTIVDYKIYIEGKKNYFKIVRTMFEHHIKDNIWKYQDGAVKVHNWKLYDSCGVYCVTTTNMVYYLLVEKMYPFTNNILHQLWKDVRLYVDYEVEMAYDLLRLIRRQINEGCKPK
nr:hypothetical protein [Tanacetum cinerariifolium]